MLKRTPLYQAHQKLGARLVEFGGWEMPVHYTGIIDEHLAVRQAAGLFDISHMGEFLISGDEAAAFLNRVLTNDVGKLGVNQAQYSLLCNEHGGTIDDLYVYRTGREAYLLIVNASRIESDFSWLERQVAGFHTPGAVKLTNASAQYGAVAIQGPRAADIVDAAIPGSFIGGLTKLSQLKKNQMASVALSIGSRDYGAFVGRTGYTGEDGFEIIAPAGILVFLWNKLLNLGSPYGLKPAGLGARDTLRTEMCYPLYGHELDEQITPIEAGLGFFVELNKGEFNGRSVLVEQRAKGVSKRCVAFKMAQKSAPPRPHYAIWSSGADGWKIGEVTSGTQSPSLGIGIGLGYVPPDWASPGVAIEIEIRGKRAPAVAVSKPIYRKKR